MDRCTVAYISIRHNRHVSTYSRQLSKVGERTKDKIGPLTIVQSSCQLGRLLEGRCNQTPSNFSTPPAVFFWFSSLVILFNWQLDSSYFGLDCLGKYSTNRSVLYGLLPEPPHTVADQFTTYRPVIPIRHYRHCTQGLRHFQDLRRNGKEKNKNETWKNSKM